MQAQVQAQNSKINWQELATTLDPELVRQVIARETRSWATSLLILGFVQLVASHFLDPVWGVVLILLAAASFYFRNGAILPVYGVTMACAMVSNLLSGQVQWVGFGLLQGYWAFGIFRQFVILRRAASCLGTGLGAGASGHPDRAAGIFPWAGCALSAASLSGLVALIIVMVVWPVFTGQELGDQTIGLAAGGLWDLACLGLALGVAALLARFRWRPVSILAVIGGGMMLGFFSLLMLSP